jgi:proteasome lid subunit RPN8/RPN11
MNQHNNLRRLVANFPRYSKNWVRWLIVLGESTPNTARELLDRLQVQPAPCSRATASFTGYVVSSLFLHKCHRHLTDGPAENLHLVTGIVLDDRFIMTDMVALNHVDRQVARAFANPGDVRNGLLMMESFGLRCGGLFHSHPGRGIASTSPSGTDWRNQRAWEQAYRLIGAVFSRDGFVQFFGPEERLHIEVYGKKVRQIDVALFQLELDGGVPLPESPEWGPGVGLGG